MAHEETQPPSQIIEDQLDRLVDVRGYSYYDARRELGIPTPIYEPQDKSVQTPSVAATDYPKHFSFGEWRDLPPAQKAINHAGVAAIREALSQSKARRGI
jgi:hypothetical protein